MKIFRVDRKSDESGVSGAGHVINGVVFDDGTVVIRWRTSLASIAIYKNFDEFKAIHIDSHPTNETVVKTWEIDTTRIICTHPGKYTRECEGCEDFYIKCKPET